MSRGTARHVQSTQYSKWWHSWIFNFLVYGFRCNKLQRIDEQLGSNLRFLFFPLLIYTPPRMQALRFIHLSCMNKGHAGINAWTERGRVRTKVRDLNTSAVPSLGNLTTTVDIWIWPCRGLGPFECNRAEHWVLNDAIMENLSQRSTSV